MSVMMFNWADYTIISLIGLSVVISLARGFVREALSLISWIAAFWVAFTFYGLLAELLTKEIHSNTVRMVVAFSALFLITLIIGALINYLIGKLVDKTGLSGTDRLIGVVFGFTRGALLVTILLMLAKLTPMAQEPWWKSSVLIQYFKPVEIWLQDKLPKSLADHWESAEY